MACQRWLSIRLDSFGAFLVLAVAMLTVGTRFTISPGQTGVALSYILSAQSIWSWVIRQSAEIENNMSSVERMVHYANHVETEPPHSVPETDSKLPAAWPAAGEIRFEHVTARHRPDLPVVLDGIDLTIAPGEHVAVCGRTGAGKSTRESEPSAFAGACSRAPTVVTLLLRLMELSGGSIKIDGVDIAGLGLAALRSKISIIPQDALLFSGSLRYNLDPLDERDDATLNDAMRRACLVKGPSESSASSMTVEPQSEESGTAQLTLDTEIEEEGRNLSVGQRALVSMARALARGTQIVVLDEATGEWCDCAPRGIVAHCPLCSLCRLLDRRSHPAHAVRRHGSTYSADRCAPHAHHPCLRECHLAHSVLHQLTPRCRTACACSTAAASSRQARRSSSSTAARPTAHSAAWPTAPTSGAARSKRRRQSDSSCVQLTARRRPRPCPRPR
jgi:ABC-type polar amino acid transport system ATPase subunit